MRAFVFFFLIAAFFFWVMLSIEHGREVGKKIMKTIKQFFKGTKKKRKERDKDE